MKARLASWRLENPHGEWYAQGSVCDAQQSLIFAHRIDGLPHVVRSMNYTRHEANKRTSYQAVFGRPPSELQLFTSGEDRSIVEEIRLGIVDEEDRTRMSPQNSIGKKKLVKIERFTRTTTGQTCLLV